jgi:hypothetical protein
MKNRNTTLAGIGAILVAAGTTLNNWPTVDWAAVATAVLAGLGLIFAKDAKDGA